MICPRCGNNLDNDALFCSNCGTKRSAMNPADTTATMPGGSANNPEKPAAPTIAIIVGGIVVAACIILAAMFFCKIGPFAAPTNTTNTSVVVANNTANNASTTNANNAAEEKPGVSGEQQSQNLPDESTVNLFLSNYSENSMSQRKNYSPGAWTADDYVSWAFEHDWLNGKSRFESHSEHQSDWPAASKNDPTKYGSWRISVDNLRQVISTWFKVDIDPSRCVYNVIENGYCYFYVGAVIPPKGVTHTTSIKAIGDNKYEVEFDIYCPKNHDYDPSNSAYYSMSASELMSSFGVSAPTKRGTAVIEGSYEGAACFKLTSYSVR